jgi:hypothetical protein
MPRPPQTVEHGSRWPKFELSLERKNTPLISHHSYGSALVNTTGLPTMVPSGIRSSLQSRLYCVGLAMIVECETTLELFRHYSAPGVCSYIYQRDRGSEGIFPTHPKKKRQYTPHLPARFGKPALG